jgi:hypothetical protein
MNRTALMVAGVALFAIGALAGRQFGPGRYQIVFSPHLRADTFLLDTATGRVWSHPQFTAYEGDPTAWNLEKRFDTEDEWTRKKKTE